jgi:hypothetical protein
MKGSGKSGISKFIVASSAAPFPLTFSSSPLIRKIRHLVTAQPSSALAYHTASCPPASALSLPNVVMHAS